MHFQHAALSLVCCPQQPMQSRFLRSLIRFPGNPYRSDVMVAKPAFATSRRRRKSACSKLNPQRAPSLSRSQQPRRSSPRRRRSPPRRRTTLSLPKRKRQQAQPRSLSKHPASSCQSSDRAPSLAHAVFEPALMITEPSQMTSQTWKASRFRSTQPLALHSHGGKP